MSVEVQTAPTFAQDMKIDYGKRLMVAAGRASTDLGGKIADKLGLDLTDAGLKTFTDGEVYCRYGESIRGADIFLVQSIAGNDAEGLTVNDAMMELLVMIDAAVGASAHRVIAVCPWYGYSRQDKKSAPREPISARVVAKSLEGVGVDRVLTMDLHAGQVQGFFHVPVDHMTAMPMLSQWFLDQAFTEELVVVSPDAGRDRFAGRGLLVLAGVAEPGHHRDDPVRRGTLRCVSHKQQLHQGVVGGHAARLVGGGRLDEEDVGTANRLAVAAVDLAVGKRLQVGLAEIEIELSGDLRGKIHRAAPAEHHQALAVVVTDRGRRGAGFLDRAQEPSSSFSSACFARRSA